MQNMNRIEASSSSYPLNSTLQFLYHSITGTFSYSLRVPRLCHTVNWFVYRTWNESLLPSYLHQHYIITWKYCVKRIWKENVLYQNRRKKRTFNHLPKIKYTDWHHPSVKQRDDQLLQQSFAEEEHACERREWEEGGNECCKWGAKSRYRC